MLINLIQESKLMESKDYELEFGNHREPVVSKDDGMNILDKNSNKVQ